MNIEDIISKKVSFQNNAWSSISTEVLIKDIIIDIKKGKYADEIQKLRFYLKNNEKEKYDIYKKRLPGVTFCANFETLRKKENIKNYNYLIVIDIDKLGNEEMSRISNILQSDNYVFTFWISPSENGIKGLIYLDYEFDIEKYGIDKSHKIAFQQLTEYFKTEYSIILDISGSDTTRLCFMSHDSKLLFKSKIEPFHIKEVVPEISSIEIKPTTKKSELKINYLSNKDILNNPKGKNNQKDKQTIVKIIKYLKKNNISITTSYEDWYRVAYAIANTFTYDIGEKYYLSICELDGNKHDEIQSKNMLLYCYNNNRKTINFNTITFFAINKGFNI